MDLVSSGSLATRPRRLRFYLIGVLQSTSTLAVSWSAKKNCAWLVLDIEEHTCLLLRPRLIIPETDDTEQAAAPSWRLGGFRDLSQVQNHTSFSQWCHPCRSATTFPVLLIPTWKPNKSPCRGQSLCEALWYIIKHWNWRQIHNYSVQRYSSNLQQYNTCCHSNRSKQILPTLTQISCSQVWELCIVFLCGLHKAKGRFWKREDWIKTNKLIIKKQAMEI